MRFPPRNTYGVAGSNEKSHNEKGFWCPGIEIWLVPVHHIFTSCSLPHLHVRHTHSHSHTPLHHHTNLPLYSAFKGGCCYKRKHQWTVWTNVTQFFYSELVNVSLYRPAFTFIFRPDWHYHTAHHFLLSRLFPFIWVAKLATLPPLMTHGSGQLDCYLEAAPHPSCTCCCWRG